MRRTLELSDLFARSLESIAQRPLLERVQREAHAAGSRRAEAKGRLPTRHYLDIYAFRLSRWESLHPEEPLTSEMRDFVAALRALDQDEPLALLIVPLRTASTTLWIDSSDRIIGLLRYDERGPSRALEGDAHREPE